MRKGEVVCETEFVRGNIESLLARGLISDVNDLHNDIQDAGVVSKNNFPKWKKRLAICTAIWKRYEIFELFANATKKLNNDNLEIIVIVAGSDGNESKSIVEKHGFIYIEIQNEPLATKMNATTILAAELNCDYVLCVGSDDVITNDLLEIYKNKMFESIDYVAVLDWYFYDTITNKFAYWGGYIDSRKGHTCGAGRLISMSLLNKWKNTPWEVKHSKVLDNSMQEKLKNTKHSSYIFSLKEFNVYAFDIKSDVNMTPFQLWENTKYIDDDNVKKQYKLCVE
jgi:hypothetical protein